MNQPTNTDAMTPEQRREAVVEYINAHPAKGYYEVGILFGLNPSTVSKIARAAGIYRQRGGLSKMPDGATPVQRKASPRRRCDMLAQAPATPKRREGGIMANDEQWAARRHVIGGGW